MTNDERIKALAAVVGLGGLLVGAYQFLQLQAIEAARPYLEKKLHWCEAAVETTAAIATRAVPAEADVQRFWEMYWGVMGLIEKAPITDAMIAFGEVLRTGAVPPDAARRAALTGRSLDLAHACRTELAAEWSPFWAR
jgi:hypothetical protein